MSDSLYDTALALLQSRVVGLIQAGKVCAQGDVTMSVNLAEELIKECESREENKRQEKAATKKKAGFRSPTTDEGEEVFTFPCVGSQSYVLREAKFLEYKKSFPGPVLMGELRKALQWLRDNPTRQKTPRGMPRFLGAWLSRAQNDGSPHAPATLRVKEATDEEASVFGGS